MWECLDSCGHYSLLCIPLNEARLLSYIDLLITLLLILHDCLIYQSYRKSNGFTNVMFITNIYSWTLIMAFTKLFCLSRLPIESLVPY